MAGGRGAGGYRGYQGELYAALLRMRKKEAARKGEIHLDPFPEEACGRTWDGNDACTLREGHPGPCNVKRGEEG